MHLDPGPLVVVLVLASSVLHATWNAIAHSAPDRLVGFALISLATAVVGAGMVVFGPPVSGRQLAFAAISGAMHVAYLVLLWTSYRTGDLSRAYPLARGTGVALVAVASAFAPRSPLGPSVVVGAGLVVVGLVGVTLAGPPLTRTDRAGVLAAVATGAAIAGYTVVDGLAVSGGAPVVSYAGWVFLIHGSVLPVVALVRRRGALLGVPRRQVVTGLAGGVVSLVAYSLVLLAQTSGALAAVAALRELSIAVGVVVGVVVLREPAARSRLLPALVLTGGAVVLASGLG